MSTHTITGFITHQQRPWEKEPQISFQTYLPSAEYSPDTVVIREHTIEVEVDDSFDPRPAKVAKLEEQKRQARAAFAKRVKEIDDQIQRLLAIDNVSAVEAVDG